ncbi:MAG: MlaD family protein [Bacteroidetes bacterium]|nr:MlaD family protein [Bacteroidota bacterium]
MNQENKRSVLVGLFVLIGIVILVAGIMTLGGQQKKFMKAIHVKAVFDDIGGLQPGNNIWFSGVKIGTVRKIKFFGNSQVEVEMSVEEKVAEFIRKNSKATISSDGLIGNKIIVIYGGTTDYPVVEEGDRLEAIMPLDTDKMMETLQANNQNLVDITDDLKVLTGKIAAGEGIISAVLTDSILAVNFRTILTNLERASTNSNNMIADLNVFTGKLNKKGTLINDLVTDTSIIPDLKATIESLRITSANTQALSKEFAGITDKLNSKENSLGMLLNDPEFAKSLKKTMENADSASYNLNKGMEALEYTWPFNNGFKRKIKEKGGN